MSILSEDLTVSIGTLAEHGYVQGRNINCRIDWETIKHRFGFTQASFQSYERNHRTALARVYRLVDMVMEGIAIEDLTPDGLLRSMDSVGKFDAVTYYWVGMLPTKIRIGFWTKKSHGSKFALQCTIDLSLNRSIADWLTATLRQANMFKYKQCFGKGYEKCYYVRNNVATGNK